MNRAAGPCFWQVIDFRRNINAVPLSPGFLGGVAGRGWLYAGWNMARHFREDMAMSKPDE
jgi:hypothetical protein